MSQTIRLMIVDDNAHTRRALAAYVSGLDGVKLVAEAFDGQDALEKLEASTPDVVVMDCRMPRLTGPEATRILKHRLPGIKVLVLTLYPEYEHEARQAGADVVLMKGCAAAQLASAIRTILMADPRSIGSRHAASPAGPTSLATGRVPAGSFSRCGKREKK